MAQVFSPAADTWLRVVFLFVALAVVVFFLAIGGYVRSGWDTLTGFPQLQPVPFSHKHHVGGLGIDCRYCHTSVEISSEAGFPPTHTCMTCHSQVWTGAPMLAPVRQSLAFDRPIHWTRLHDLPDYVYFNHSVHVTHGVGCSTCHGRVDEMPLMRKAETFQMQWCLNCHRDPAPHLRPPDKVFDMAWTPADDQRRVGEALMARYGIHPERLDHCYVCHR